MLMLSLLVESEVGAALAVVVLSILLTVTSALLMRWCKHRIADYRQYRELKNWLEEAGGRRP